MSCTSAVFARNSPALGTSSFPSTSFGWPFLAGVHGTFFPTLHLILEDSRTHHPALVRQCLLIILLQLFCTFSYLLHLIPHPLDLHALLPSARLPFQLVLILTAQEQACHVVLDTFNSSQLKFGTPNGLDADGEMSSRRILNRLTVSLVFVEELGQQFVETLNLLGVALMEELTQFCILHELIVIFLHEQVHVIVSRLAPETQPAFANTAFTSFCPCRTPCPTKFMNIKMMFWDGRHGDAEFIASALRV
jgi:hypothetical protein